MVFRSERVVCGMHRWDVVLRAASEPEQAAAGVVQVSPPPALQEPAAAFVRAFSRSESGEIARDRP